MAAVLKLFKRQALEYDEDDGEMETTLATKIFDKHLHRGRQTTTRATTEAGGEFSLNIIVRVISRFTDYGTAESTVQKISDKTFTVAGVVGEKTGFPTWGVILIILGICGFFIYRCYRHRRFTVRPNEKKTNENVVEGTAPFSTV